MALLSFFKKPKHRNFKYVPRYWDEDKEDLNRRIKQAQSKEDIDIVKSRISKTFKGKHNPKMGFRSTQVRRSNMRLVLIIGILIVLTYIVMMRLGPAIEKLLG